MLNPDQYKAFIFDLDNTIYKETDYLFPAYRKIAEYVATKESVNAKEAKRFLTESFLNNGREKLFDKFMERFQIRNSTKNDFLNILRTNKTESKLRMNENISSFIKKLIANNKSLFVLTNGNVEQQKNKVSLVDWEGIQDKLKFVFANESEKKPSPLAVKKIIQENHYREKDIIMIGDGTEDEDCAKNASIGFIHVNDLLKQLTNEKNK